MNRTHCPHCGASLPRGASACPDCGSDEQTGWADEGVRDEALWGEFDEQDYEDVVRDIAGNGDAGQNRVMLIVTLVALAAFLAFFIF